jgi:hypothetical protein
MADTAKILVVDDNEANTTVIAVIANTLFAGGDAGGSTRQLCDRSASLGHVADERRISGSGRYHGIGGVCRYSERGRDRVHRSA